LVVEVTGFANYAARAAANFEPQWGRQSWEFQQLACRLIELGGSSRLANAIRSRLSGKFNYHHDSLSRRDGASFPAVRQGRGGYFSAEEPR